MCVMIVLAICVSEFGSRVRQLSITHENCRRDRIIEESVEQRAESDESQKHSSHDDIAYAAIVYVVSNWL